MRTSSRPDCPLCFSTLGATYLPVLSFWTINGLLLVVDTTGKPNFISRYRIQLGKNEPVRVATAPPCHSPESRGPAMLSKSSPLAQERRWPGQAKFRYTRLLQVIRLKRRSSLVQLSEPASQDYCSGLLVPPQAVLPVRPHSAGVSILGGVTGSAWHWAESWRCKQPPPQPQVQGRQWWLLEHGDSCRVWKTPVETMADPSVRDGQYGCLMCGWRLFCKQVLLPSDSANP